MSKINQLHSFNVPWKPNTKQQQDKWKVEAIKWHILDEYQTAER